MNLKDLQKKIPYKWKIQAKPKQDKMGVCVAYIDARDCQDILDEVCWQDKRQNRYVEIKWKLFCEIGILTDNWRIWKSDSWSLEQNDDVNYETTSKWETSDSFKRACVQRGIGRFLYSLDKVFISAKEYEQNKFKINEFIKWKVWNKQKQQKTDFTADLFEKFKAKSDNYKNADEAIKKLEENYFLSDEARKQISDLYDFPPELW